MKIRILFLLFFGVYAVKCDLKKEPFRCIHKVTYQENDCNYCYCWSETLGCTERLCLDKENDDHIKCEVGTTWNKGCNQCWCVQEYGVICRADEC